MARKPSPLAQCAKLIRSDISAAAAKRSLPPFPAGITFRVTIQHRSASTSVFIELLNGPRPWLIDRTPCVVNRRSPEWERLHRELTRIAARQAENAGLAPAIYVQSDNELGNEMLCLSPDEITRAPLAPGTCEWCGRNTDVYALSLKTCRACVLEDLDRNGRI